MDIQDVFYHGIREQVRRVLDSMTDRQIDAGLTAFDTGGSNWSHCFFARAFAHEASLDSRDDRRADLRGLDPEQKLMKLLGLHTAIPIRIVYCTFDGVGKFMSKQELAAFIRDIRLDHDGAFTSLKRVSFEGVEDREIASCP